MPFHVEAPFSPAGDQGPAIDELVRSLRDGKRFVTLQGVTGVGKTYIMAKVIEEIGKPTLIISHNKTLAAQLYEEMRAFFPRNATEYFVSYYDYYQPEAYVPQSDTYIAKESDINKEIEKLRHSATQSLVTRDDVVVVSSVSCIYGLGSPEEYRAHNLVLQVGATLDRKSLTGRLVDIYYERNDADLKPGTFRVRGDTIDILPPGDEHPIRVELFGDDIERITRVDHLSGEAKVQYQGLTVFPAKHFVMSDEQLEAALGRIQVQLRDRLGELRQQGKILEAARLEQRTRFDMEMLREIGYCNGVENYSQPLSGRPRGDPGGCLIDYFPKDYLLIVDESHVSIPQIRGMYNGDRMRKETLIDYGFRLPSALDNRPLKFAEFEKKFQQVVFTSATPGPYEAEHEQVRVKAVVRPTGLIDPEVEVRPVAGQVDDLYGEIVKTTKRGERVLVTTLTKRMAEELTKYYQGLGLKVTYLHSDIDTLERIIILEKLRKGEFDVLVGINLLREGLDLPEVSLVAIFDADKIGFLRSETSLVQTIGRAARNLNGRVIMYADRMSDAMKSALDATNERRVRQLAYNKEHGITPKSTVRSMKGIEIEGRRLGERPVLVAKDRLAKLDKTGFDRLIKDLETEMQAAAKAWDFEKAALLRDEILQLKSGQLPKDAPSERQLEAQKHVEEKVGPRVRNRKVGARRPPGEDTALVEGEPSSPSAEGPANRKEEKEHRPAKGQVP
ncbi:MAG TPA: excinuclease ABC subunit UvrB [Candidatus Thermoplasmatota archaeon]|nr:excinuclease ABC subunit UvrB [Candidatus Thermoplasmatota archaeon]